MVDAGTLSALSSRSQWARKNMIAKMSLLNVYLAIFSSEKASESNPIQMFKNLNDKT